MPRAKNGDARGGQQQGAQPKQRNVSASEMARRQKQSRDDRKAAAAAAQQPSSGSSRRRNQRTPRISRQPGGVIGPWKLEHHGPTRVDRVVERFEITMLSDTLDNQSGNLLLHNNTPDPPDQDSGIGSLRGVHILGIYAPEYKRHTLALYNMEIPDTHQKKLKDFEHLQETASAGLHSVLQDPPIVVQNTHDSAGTCFARVIDSHLVIEVTLGASSRGVLMVARTTGEISGMTPKDAHSALVRDRHMVERYPLTPGRVNRIHVRPGIRQQFAYGRFRKAPNNDPEAESINESDSNPFHAVVFGFASYAQATLDAPALLVAHTSTFVETELPLSLNHLADNLPKVGHGMGIKKMGGNGKAGKVVGQGDPTHHIQKEHSQSAKTDSHGKKFSKGRRNHHNEL